MPRFRLFTCLLFVAVTPLFAQEPPQGYTPKIMPASPEGERAIARFKVPAGFKVELWAAEPMLANPVCFTFDEKGRMFVAETFRLHAGVTDIRGHMNWLDDDLACRTVEDRDKLMRKWTGKKYGTYAEHHDRIRLLEDTKGTGKADKATVFADGFQSAVSGIGAGLLAMDGKVWYTCIPHLWLLEDTKGTGKADKRTVLSEGYGVHIGFLGHDLHGLIKGPDGRLYFTLGDRGCHIKTKEGKVLSNPDSGCVLRCEPDGSNLEIYAVGLRNPQELAFDEFGNLFTVDNNSDGGDKARLTYIVEGGDYGWRIGYQFLHWPVPRGPWNAEQMWVPEKARDVAYIVPSLANIADGPSGLAYYPGVGLPDRYKGHFFLADFRGTPANSGIRSFAVEPHGAGFKIKDEHEFLWGILATDVQFGPDCALYVSDWVNGWDMTGKGRIYKVTDPEKVKSKEVEQAKSVLADIPTGKWAPRVGYDGEGLWQFLDHQDMRVRFAAVSGLVAGTNTPEEKQATTSLASIYAHSFGQIVRGYWENANDGKSQRRHIVDILPKRLHSLWGFEQLCRGNDYFFLTYFPTQSLFDSNTEVRAQGAKTYGELSLPLTFAKQKSWLTVKDKDKLYDTDKVIRDKLISLLQDPSPRVRFFAAQSLGKLKHKPAVQPLLAMLRANNEQDPFLRHAAVLALVRIDDRAALHQAMKDESAAVRLAVCVALRRLEDPALMAFLDDIDPRLVLEAARAIYDAPIPAGLPKLAELVWRRNLPEAVWFRVLNAHFRLGQAANAQAIAQMAARSDLPANVRMEALLLLGQWEKPSGRDRIVGLWRPLPSRPREQAANAYRPVIAGVLTGPGPMRAEGMKLAGKLNIKEVGPLLRQMIADQQQPAPVRAQALQALQALHDPHLLEMVEKSLQDTQPLVRTTALTVYAKMEPAAAWPVLQKAAQRGHLLERQAAITALGTIDHEQAEATLAEGLEKLLQNRIPEAMQLELITAAKQRSSPRLKDLLRRYEEAMKQQPLGPYRTALAGGDAERGRNIFLHKEAVSCLRCHKIGGTGGEVGPDLTKIGGEKSREYLLEAIVDPNKQIAKGFETVLLLLKSGKIVSGVLKGETATELKLMTPEAQLLTIPKKEIDERQTGKSSMPEDLIQHLSLAELRDLVEFLAGQK
jgi:quinoprotein glucose dehydrogenase